MEDANALITEFIRIRDKRSANKAEYEKADAELKLVLDSLEQKLLGLCKEAGVSGLKTDAGTATKSVKAFYWANDWESMHAFIKENQALDLLERRISQNNMRTFLQAHPDVMPPGLNIDQRYTITVRRKSA